MVYHYTSIESFAAILKSNKIRFSRLDFVDDPEEYHFIKNGMNPAKYVFVSCWTRTSEENIPQWRLYGNNGHGVRIGMDENMFPVIYNSKGQANFFPDNYFDDKEFMILPFIPNGKILFDIEYVDELNSKINKIFRTFEDIDSEAIDFKEMGIYKKQEWAFQNECRYKIVILPLENGMFPRRYLTQGIAPKIKYIDISLNASTINKMSITVGPFTSESERTIIEALIDKYARKAYVSHSVFANYF